MKSYHEGTSEMRTNQKLEDRVTGDKAVVRAIDGETVIIEHESFGEYSITKTDVKLWWKEVN